MAAAYGNYKGYQGSSRTTDGQNLGAHILDERLVLLSTALPTLFPNRRILDIGCNQGHIAVDIALSLAPRTVTGIDLDAQLVAKAKSHLSFRWSRCGPAGEPNFFPASAVLQNGHVPYPPHSAAFPHNVRFVCADFTRWDGDGDEEEEYDVVLMLSVVKWLHLQAGDEGLKRAFAAAAKALVTGGHLVLEPQEWDSYGRAVKKNPGLRLQKEALEIGPEQFGELLAEVGLVEVEALVEGRKRGLWVYRKGGE